MTKLKAITEENFIDAFNLKLVPGQERFVSHPIRSLAQAYVYRNQCQPFAIYADDKMTGYGIGEYIRNRRLYQAALDRVLDYVRTKPIGSSDRIALMTCNRNNHTARKLYESRGFSATGVEDEDEIELVLMLE